MIDVPSTFNKYQQFVNEAYVVDYTNHPTDEHTALELLPEAPSVMVEHEGRQVPMPYFALVKHNTSRDCAFYGVNFEENHALFEGHKQCECLFTPETGHKPWVLLLEMKYCKPGNEPQNMNEALQQLVATLTYLESIDKINRHEQRIYLNISMPWSDAEPFTSFRETLNDVAEALANDKVMLLGYNKLLIHTESVIKAARVEV